MKGYYKIQEIARLYGVAPDTIRYYEEQDLIHPKRTESNYRLFSIRDIGTLNIIRDLRQLDMSTEEIHSYIHQRSVTSTLELYDREQALIEEKILTLKHQYQDIERSRRDVLAAMKLPVGKPRLLELPDRPCFTMEADSLPGSDVDFLLRKLERRHENIIKILGNTDIGASYRLTDALEGSFRTVSSVFFMGTEDYMETTIPAGTYGSVVYRGDYHQLQDAFNALTSFLAEQGLKPCGDPFELYHIDTRETCHREEYITELQVLTSPI